MKVLGDSAFVSFFRPKALSTYRRRIALALLGVVAASAAWHHRLSGEETPSQVVQAEPATQAQAYVGEHGSAQPATAPAAVTHFPFRNLAGNTGAPSAGTDPSVLEALEAWNRALEVHAAETLASGSNVEAEARDDLLEALNDLLKQKSDEGSSKARKKRFKKAKASLLASDTQLTFSARMVRLLTLTASQGPGQSARGVVDEWLGQNPPGPGAAPPADCTYEQTMGAITQFLKGIDPDPECGVTTDEGRLALVKSVPEDCLIKPETQLCQDWFRKIYNSI